MLALLTWFNLDNDAVIRILPIDYNTAFTFISLKSLDIFPSLHNIKLYTYLTVYLKPYWHPVLTLTEKCPHRG